MKKIAYIELDTHAEIALNFMELMNDSKVFSVDYYFSEKILKTLGLQETENKIKSNHQTIFKQLQTKNYDLIIIGTVHRYFNVFEKIAEKFNTSIICHNLNFVKASNFDLLSSVFKEDFQYRLKLLLKEGLLRKSKVYKKAKNLLVLDRGFDSAQPDKYTFLPIFYTKFLEKPKNETYTIVIPGAVSQKRRNYERVLKSIKIFHFPFEIIFLGKASGKELEMLQDFEKSKPDNISIKYFTEKVLQDIFDHFMQKADVLWCPIQQETAFFSQKEIYGFTKMSGNIGDAIKYGKLAVFPKNYPSKYSFIIPEKGSLGDFLFIKKDVDFSEFSKEKVLQELEKTIFALL
ncbi:hypothetical protein [Cloacibacterium caeni]|uniref:hypothetical protein n=1 Tax=Cloacibacterium caeni TaxID=2004710 RepID=UPI001BCE262B|nr:hypothetical protein [Cloacibacterium caeni]